MWPHGVARNSPALGSRHAAAPCPACFSPRNGSRVAWQEACRASRQPRQFAGASTRHTLSSRGARVAGRAIPGFTAEAESWPSFFSPFHSGRQTRAGGSLVGGGQMGAASRTAFPSGGPCCPGRRPSHTWPGCALQVRPPALPPGGRGHAGRCRHCHGRLRAHLLVSGLSAPAGELRVLPPPGRQPGEVGPSKPQDEGGHRGLGLTWPP